MKIFLIFFISIYGVPPSIMPEFESLEKKNYIYFNTLQQCENYLTIVAIKKYKNMKISSHGSGKFLRNPKASQFVICKEFSKNKLLKWE
ncbi:MAG: hypothetical protein CMJ13_03880 [Pelagibacterales bacterium]|nr:hypothetical protein [Pelagibacterales bacterium]